ncbi:MAG: Pyridine nucleotide-disulfide oxidoreductase, partial [Microgenomates group bacterium GW2011_GWA2_46_7]
MMFKPDSALEIQPGVFKTKIEGLYFLAYNFVGDERGFFAEVGHTHKIEAVTGQPFKIAQINHSRSLLNVVRGMHAEGWNKLVTVINGFAFSALADVRPGSSTFGVVEIFELGPDNPEALNYLGYIYAEENRNLDEAEQLVKKALDIDPDNGAYLDSLGWVYYKKGVFTLRTLKDAIEIKKYAEHSNRVVLIGGGVLGLEAGNSLRKTGHSIFVVEFFPRLLPRQMDQEGADILKTQMEKMGFAFFLGAKTREIAGDDK